ncbi:MAG: hypothetical protein RLZZ609_1379 [Cyanobacteriota bacterium]
MVLQRVYVCNIEKFTLYVDSKLAEIRNSSFDASNYIGNILYQVLGCSILLISDFTRKLEAICTELTSLAMANIA